MIKGTKGTAKPPVHTTFAVLGELINRELSKIYIMTESAKIDKSNL